MIVELIRKVGAFRIHAVIREKSTYQDYTHVVMGVFKETFTTNLPEAEE
jgi:hypothetical protein